MIKRNTHYNLDDIEYTIDGKKLICIQAGITSPNPINVGGGQITDGEVIWKPKSTITSDSGDMDVEFDELSFTVPDKAYGYVTKVYFKDMLKSSYRCECEDSTLLSENHLCCLYVKYKQGSSSQNTSNNYPTVISGVVLPTSELINGNLRLTPSGEIWALGQHSAGSVYDGFVYYEYTRNSKV